MIIKLHFNVYGYGTPDKKSEILVNFELHNNDTFATFLQIDVDKQF